MKYTIFPFTDTPDNEKDTELFVFTVGNVGQFGFNRHRGKRGTKVQLMQRSSLYYNS